MATHTTTDQAKTEAFLGKVLSDTSGLTTTIMASIGDRLGLFRNLVESPATSEELAQRTHNDERYVREWLYAMTSAGYIAYDPASSRFTLPAAYMPVLVQESGPMFFGGIHQWVTALARQIEPIIQAFRDGGGVPQAAYDEITWDGQERFTNTWFESLLIPVWMPLMPEVHSRLERGTTLADIGCGRGRAIVKLAQAYPNSHFVGYDVYGPSIEHARLLAQQAGVAERVRFQQLDASRGFPISTMSLPPLISFTIQQSHESYSGRFVLHYNPTAGMFVLKSMRRKHWSRMRDHWGVSCMASASSIA